MKLEELIKEYLEKAEKLPYRYFENKFPGRNFLISMERLLEKEGEAYAPAFCRLLLEVNKMSVERTIKDIDTALEKEEKTSGEANVKGVSGAW